MSTSSISGALNSERFCFAAFTLLHSATSVDPIIRRTPDQLDTDAPRSLRPLRKARFSNRVGADDALLAIRDAGEGARATARTRGAPYPVLRGPLQRASRSSQCTANLFNLTNNKLISWLTRAARESIARRLARNPCMYAGRFFRRISGRSFYPVPPLRSGPPEIVLWQNLFPLPWSHTWHRDAITRVILYCSPFNASA